MWFSHPFHTSPSLDVPRPLIGRRRWVPLCARSWGRGTELIHVLASLKKVTPELGELCREWHQAETNREGPGAGRGTLTTGLGFSDQDALTSRSLPARWGKKMVKVDFIRCRHLLSPYMYWPGMGCPSGSPTPLKSSSRAGETGQETDCSKPR